MKQIATPTLHMAIQGIHMQTLRRLPTPQELSGWSGYVGGHNPAPEEVAMRLQNMQNILNHSRQDQASGINPGAQRFPMGPK